MRVTGQGLGTVDGPCDLPYTPHRYVVTDHKYLSHLGQGDR
jgi:hypothetical protein